ncbi:SPOR domain-containing protein [Delftia sp. PS-11]|uniref:SPOR domain-containing protein n=1 Tax=Delftia sp. PS-11 TaxID=2767222 RepID=UPI0024587D4A|nr:SPOR domain-containing protein [Delftia sp. PS-11]KAJ8744675.1 SPOR domain-containing protein [Delftia sp. PS-11]
MALFKFRWPGKQDDGDSPSASRRPSRLGQPESVEVMRRRARHRLIGAAVLVLGGVLGFPLLFDTQPRPVPVDIPIEIPDRDKVAPLVVPGENAVDSKPQGASSRVAPQASLGAGEEELAVGKPALPTLPSLPAAPAVSQARPDGRAEVKPVQPALKPEPKPEPKPAPKPEPKPAPRPEPKPEPKPAPKPEPKPEPKPAPKPEPKPAPKPEPKPEPKPAPKPEPKPEPKPVQKPETKPEPKAEHKPEPKPQPKPEPSKADEAARARALLEGRSTPAAAPAPAAAAAADERFIVQVGAFAEASKAQEIRAKLELAGLKTFTQVVDTKDGKRTRVRVGPYNNKADAEKAAARVKGQGLPASVLKP